MPYSSFSLAQIKQQFGLQIVMDVFFDDLPPLTPGDWLINLVTSSHTSLTGRYGLPARHP
jgi:hypothetical protein